MSSPNRSATTVATLAMTLSPCWRFKPTDQVLLVEYLQKKLLNLALPCDVIKEVELYNYHPSELDQFRDKNNQKCYFFTPTRRMHEHGSRPTRTAKGGYWKASSFKLIYGDGKHNVIGTKRTLAFYNRNGKSEVKTNWIMYEYQLGGQPRESSGDDDPMKQHDRVLCSIYERLSSSNRKQKQKQKRDHEYQVNDQSTSCKRLRIEEDHVNTNEFNYEITSLANSRITEWIEDTNEFNCGAPSLADSWIRECVTDTNEFNCNVMSLDDAQIKEWIDELLS